MSGVLLFPLSNYSFGTKDPQADEDKTTDARLVRLQSEYETQGMRTTVEGVLVVHEHGHPHILMLQIANSFYKLPGGALRPGEDEIEGLKLRINQKLAPIGGDQTSQGDFEVGELLGVWWRPNFEQAMRPKEVKKMYLVHLPETKVLTVPMNMKLLAVPLFELYDNAGRYGSHLSSNQSNIHIDPQLLEKSGLTSTELQELVEIFSLVDVDHGGTISTDELASLMRTLGVKATKARLARARAAGVSFDEMNEIMNEIAKGSGEIDFESFALTVTKKVQTTITAEELRSAFNVKMSPDDAIELIRQVAPQSDKDTFDFQQFMGLYFNQ
nr:hypothetical protein HK105_007538 [Polyrhizophydium stewartii]